MPTNRFKCSYGIFVVVIFIIFFNVHCNDFDGRDFIIAASGLSNDQDLADERVERPTDELQESSRKIEHQEISGATENQESSRSKKNICKPNMNEEELDKFLKMFDQLERLIPIDIAAFPNELAAVMLIQLRRMKHDKLYRYMKEGNISDKDLSRYMMGLKGTVESCLLQDDKKIKNLFVFVDWNEISLFPLSTSLKSSRRFLESWHIKIPGASTLMNEFIYVLSDSFLVKRGVESSSKSLPKHVTMQVSKNVHDIMKKSEYPLRRKFISEKYDSDGEFEEHKVNEHVRKVIEEMSVGID